MTSPEDESWERYLETLPDEDSETPIGGCSLAEVLSNIHRVSTADRRTIDQVVQFLRVLDTVLTDVLFIGPGWRRPHAHRMALLRVLRGVEEANWLVPARGDMHGADTHD